MEGYSKNIVCFDVETTGFSKQNDWIIQFAAIKFNSDTFEEVDSVNWVVKPCRDFTISKESFDIHGITKEKVMTEGKTLKEYFPELQSFFEGCDICGYNSSSFDLEFLFCDLRKNGIEWEFKGRHIDVMYVEKYLNSMKLGEVYKRYNGKYFDNAHDALADTRATINVLWNQMRNPRTLEFLKNTNQHQITSPDSIVGMNDKDKLVFLRGKYIRRAVYDICCTDPGYIKWLSKTVSKQTMKSIEEDWYKCRENGKEKEK